MPVPQGIPTGLGQVVKADPYIAAGGAGEVFPPYTPVFLREVGVVAVGVDCIRIGPLNLGGRWVELANSDASEYGGSGWGNLGGVEASAEPMHGRPWSLPLVLPPLGLLVLAPA